MKAVSYTHLDVYKRQEWTNRQSMEMRDIIRAVEKLIVYAEKYGRKAYENNPDY